jgi:hypothetical protein
MSQLTSKVKVEYVGVLYTKLGTKVEELFSYDDHDYAIEEAKERLSSIIQNNGYLYYYIVIEERIVPIYE